MMIEDKKTKSDIRNIGIIAHIDAGKTTTTERILFFTGVTKKMGEVHEGATVTDWLEQERERGITIISSAVTCYWNKTQINIIDTPGHIDFSGEVDRSLRVLDAVVVILCGVGGVEPQTESVWIKADEKNIPKIIFINKLDREGASFENVCTDLFKTFVKKEFIVLHVPLGMARTFRGYIDLLERKAFIFSLSVEDINLEDVVYDDLFKCICLSLDNPKHKEYLNRTYSEDMMIAETLYRPLLEEKLGSNVTQQLSNLRELVISNLITPIICGASLQNIGTRHVLNYIVSLFPSPEEKGDLQCFIKNEASVIARSKENNESVGLVFKVVNDKYVGQYVVCRWYSGKVSKGTFLTNTTNSKRERVSRILRIQADQKVEIDEAFAGDIIGIVGTKHSVAGHTLCTEESNIVLNKIGFSEPVVSAAIEAKTQKDYDNLPEVLRKLAAEDQTFIYKIDKETKETIISGMGKLHLEVMTDRMRSEYAVNVILKDPKVRYRESIASSVKDVEGKFIRQKGGRGQYGHIVIDMEPSTSRLEFKNAIFGGVISEGYISSVERALNDIMENGVLAGFPIFGVKVTLKNGSQHEVDSSDEAFRRATEIAFKKAFAEASPFLLEPIAEVVITSPEDYIGVIMGDLSSKRAEITDTLIEMGRVKLTALVPRAQIFDYADVLRSLSSGKAILASVEHSDFKALPKAIMEKIVSQTTT